MQLSHGDRHTGDRRPGDRLGPYEILSVIGAGGMGEVYKARDTRLDRIVAIKTSYAKFSDRFEREARAVAALNHPNICQIYDVGPDYLVMEYVEGTRLSPVDSSRKLLDIAVQLSDGLAAAHAAKIIHRDLKPDNILITREGKVKILDFGIARSFGTDPGPDDETRADLTDPGSVVGTIAYMSPEQARGEKNLTAQSDQFSLGLVLYEMAAGKQAFRRGSAAETMTAIIRDDAEPLPATVPAPLRWIIERLLSKEPAERYDSTRDLYRELRQVRERITEATGSSAQPKRTQSRSKGRMVARWAIGAAILAGTFLAGTFFASPGAWIAHPAGKTSRQTFTPMEVSWENPSRPIWSPDGKAFAYIAGGVGDRHVFLRYLNSPTPTQLTLAANEWNMAGWSADSKRVIVRGRNPQGNKPPWALLSVAVFGGEPQLIMPLEGDLASIPTVSPDGKALVVLRTEQGGKFSVYTASPVGSALNRYAPAPFDATYQSDGSSARFSPDGRSIMLVVEAVGGRQAWKLPYPAGQGTAERILKDLPTTGETFWSWFPDGRSFVMALDSHLWLAGLHSGLRQPLTAGISSESQFWPALSPDGTKLLFVQSRTDYMILSASLSDAAVHRVISSEVIEGMPAWALHRDEFVYTSHRSGSPAIWMRGDGGDRPVVTAESFPPGTSAFFTPALSPAGDRVVYTRVDDKDGRFENWISSVSGGPPVRLTNAKDVVERGGSWSPDGGQVVYWRYRDGKAGVMIARTTGDATPTMIREDVGNPLPEWSPDGLWIKFLDPLAGGWTLISPDGKTVHTFGEPKAVQTTFSADSKRLYGVRVDQDRNTLFSLDIATKEEKTIGDIGKDFTPASYSNPGVRLSLSPDGKSILYPALRRSSGLWMLENFDPPGWMARLREMLSRL
jgi:serine/threonine protein kinase/Tol biopolymer transport system component